MAQRIRLIGWIGLGVSLFLPSGGSALTVRLGAERERAARLYAKLYGVPLSKAHKALRQWERRHGIVAIDGLQIPEGADIRFVELRPSPPFVVDHGQFQLAAPFLPEYLERLKRMRGKPGYKFFMTLLRKAVEEGRIPVRKAVFRKYRQPVYYKMLVVGIQFPEWQDQYRGESHPKVQSTVHGPSPVDFRNYFYWFILDPTNPNSLRNYWYSSSHGYVRFEGTEDDVRGWINNPNVFYSGGGKAWCWQVPPKIRLYHPYTEWKRPDKPTSPFYRSGWIHCYCYYVHDHEPFWTGTIDPSRWDQEASALEGAFSNGKLVAPGFWMHMFGPNMHADGTIVGGVYQPAGDDNRYLNRSYVPNPDSDTALNTLRANALTYFDGDNNGYPFFDNDGDGVFTWNDGTDNGNKAEEPIDNLWSPPDRDAIKNKKVSWPWGRWAPQPYDHSVYDDGNFFTGGIFGRFPHNFAGLIDDVIDAITDSHWTNPPIDPNNYDKIIIVVPTGPADAWVSEAQLGGKWALIHEDDSLRVAAHEVGHLLGLPDLYDLDRYPGHNPSGLDFISHGLGPWSLMAEGVRLDPWCKVKSGWVKPIVVVSSEAWKNWLISQGLESASANFHIGDLINAQLPYLEDPLREPVVYKVWSNVINPDTGQPEYFLIENHNKHLFGDSTPYGMLIYHIDDAQHGNEDEDFYQVALEQADGKFELETTPSGGGVGSGERTALKPSAPGLLRHLFFWAPQRGGTRQGNLNGDPWPCPANLHKNYNPSTGMIDYGPYGQRPQNDFFTYWTLPNVLDHAKQDTYVRITNISSKGSLMTCNIYVVPRKLLVYHQDLTPASAPQGARDVPMLRVTFYLPRHLPENNNVEQAEEVRITSIRLYESGSSKNDSDVERVKLYVDDGDGNFDPSKDTLIAEGTFQNQYCTLKDFTLVVPRDSDDTFSYPSDGKTVFISYDISPTAQTRPTITLGAEISDTFMIGVPPYVTIDDNADDNPSTTEDQFPIKTDTTSSGHVLVTEATDTLTVELVDLAPDTVSQGTDTSPVDGKPINRVPMAQLALSVNRDSVAVQRLKIRKAGSAPDSAVEAVRLYWDKNGNAQLDASDPLVQSVSFEGGIATFDDFSVFGKQGLTITEGNPVYLLVVYDISDTAEPGKTIGAAIKPYDDVTLVDPDDLVAPDQLLSSTESLIERAAHTLQVQFRDLAPTYLDPDADPCPSGSIYYESRGARMAKVILTPLSGKITVGSLRVHLTGDAVPAEDVYEIKVYQDADGDDIPDTPDAPLASQSGDAFQNGSVLLDLNPDVTVLVGSSAQLLVVIDIAQGARVGRQMGVSFQSPSDIDAGPDSVSATLPWNSTVGTIRGYLNASGDSLAPSTALQGATDVPFVYLDLQSAQNPNGLASDLYITQIRFDQTGTATDSDIQAAHLYLDDGDGNFDPSADTKLADSTQTAGKVIFDLTGLPEGALKVPAGETIRLFMSADISLYATPGHEIKYQVLTTSAIYGAGITVRGSGGGAFSPIPADPRTVIEDAPDTLVVKPTDLIPQNAIQSGGNYYVQPGTTSLPVAALHFSVQGDSTTISQIKFTRAGTPGEDEDVARIAVYDDRDLNGQVDPGDVLLGQGTFTAGEFTLNLTDFTVTYDQERQILVFYDVASYDQNGDVEGHKVGLYMGDPTACFTLADANDSVQWEGGATEFSTEKAQVTDVVSVQSRSLAPSTIEPGTDDVPMLRLAFTVSTGSADITSISLKHEGQDAWGSKPSDVREIRVYHDANMNDKVDGDPLVGSGTFDPDTGEATINFAAPVTVNEGSEVRLLIAFCLQDVKYDSNYIYGGRIAAEVTGIGVSSGVLDPSVEFPILSDPSQIADRVPPRLLSATAEDNTHVLLEFGEEVEEVTASNPAHYEISPALDVVEAVRVEPKKVRLTTSPQTKDRNYEVTVSGVTDLAHNEMTLWDNPPLSDPSARRAQFTGVDNVPPQVVKAYAEDGKHVVVEFSEKVHEGEAETTDNYSISPALDILSADLIEPTKVRLETSRQTPQTTYTITVSNVHDIDASGNPVNLIDPEHNSAQFTGANVAPTLSDPSLTDDFGDPGDGIGTKESTFTFKITYTDPEGDEPSYVRLVLDGTPHDMQKEDPQDNDYTDGVTYTLQLSNLDPGTHQFHFEASDGMGGTARLPEMGENSGPTVNFAPALTDGSVQPAQGKSDDTYKFSVTYTDKDGDEPTYVKVVIDGTEYALNPAGTDYKSGVVFSRELGGQDIGSGTHQFHFEASDGKQIARFPETGELTVKVNTRPQLMNAKVEPEEGTADTEFTYSVTYKDADNDPPSYVRAVIDGSTFAMQPQDPSDTNYEDGAIFVLKRKLPEGGHSFKFVASDGIEEVETDEAAGPFVGRYPALSAGGVEPEKGKRTDTFTFSVTYTHPDNRPPKWVKLVLDGGEHDMLQAEPGDTDYTDGALFTLQLSNLDPGEHSFHFKAWDGVQWDGRAEARYPAEGELTLYVNNPPQLGTPTVSPSMGTQATSFVFEVQATDRDGDPLTVELVLDPGSPSEKTFEMSRADGDTYKATVSGLGPGNHNFKVRAQDSADHGGPEEVESALQAGPYVNHAPELSGAKVEPESGLLSDTYTFEVTYKDLDGDEPLEVKLVIDPGTENEKSFDMQKVSDNPATGVLFRLQLSGSDIGPGSHNFVVRAKDSEGHGGPEEVETAQVPGPKINHPPEITCGVEPTEGTTATTFAFYATYTDKDNDRPEFVKVVVDGQPHDMQLDQNAPEELRDGNYANGERFIWTVKGSDLGVGTHKFHFEASDGKETARAPEEGEFSGPKVAANQPPALLDPSLGPEKGTQATSFSFKVTYTDAENNAPEFVRVVVDGQPHDMQLDTSAPADFRDGDYTNGERFVATVSGLEPGTHEYHFEASDGESEVRLPSQGEFSGPVVNHKPELLNPAVRPERGSQSATFTFTVTYKDADNDEPSSVLLFLDGEDVGRPMEKADPQDTNYTDGAVYKLEITGLSPGQHRFYVRAQDSDAHGGPETVQTDEVQAPYVNNRPALTNGSVQPASGSKATRFTFTVTYTDKDNDAPQFVKVVIDGQAHDMQKADPQDNDYTDGVTYTLATTLGVGTHEFHFEASDGTDAVRLPDQGEFSGPQVANLPPVLEDASFEPATGTEGTTFTFRVTYRDLDNDAPKFLDPETSKLKDGVAVILDPGTTSAKAIALQPENPQDTDYTDGAVFVVQVGGADIGAGRHTFRFEATDGTDTARFPGRGELLTLIVRGSISLSLSAPDEATLGQKATVTGSFSPAVEGLPVKVTVRKPSLPGEGKAPEPLQFDLTSDANGKFSLDLFLDRTGKWEISASFAGTDEWSPAEAEAVVSVKPLSRTFDVGLHLMSIPFAPADGRPEAVLGQDGWHVARWLPDQGRYGVDGEAGEFGLGLGFWLKAEKPITVRAEGSVPSPNEVQVIRLAPGWNMIGCPYTEPTIWSRAQVRVGTEVLPLAGAAKKGFLSSYAWAYEPGVGYVLVHERAAGATDQLEPWRGYWVKAGTECELLLPLPAERTRSAGARRARSLREWAGTEGWMAQLVVQAGGLKDAFNFFGVAPAVKATPQDYLFETPPMPSPFVDLSFIRPDARGKRFATDIRAAPSDPLTFEFEVATDLPGADVTITWPNLASVPKRFALVLEDLATGRKVYMRTCGSYTFRAGPEGGRRLFRIKVASSLAGRLRISGLRAVRTRGGLVVQFELTKPAAVSAEVRTLSGRLLRRIASDMPAPAGVVRLVWDGRDSAGRKAPAGVYLVKVVARDETGAVVRAMQTAVTVR